MDAILSKTRPKQLSRTVVDYNDALQQEKDAKKRTEEVLQPFIDRHPEWNIDVRYLFYDTHLDEVTKRPENQEYPFGFELSVWSKTISKQEAENNDNIFQTEYFLLNVRTIAVLNEEDFSKFQEDLEILEEEEQINGTENVFITESLEESFNKEKSKIVRFELRMMIFNEKLNKQPKRLLIIIITVLSVLLLAVIVTIIIITNSNP